MSHESDLGFRRLRMRPKNKTKKINDSGKPDYRDQSYKLIVPAKTKSHQFVSKVGKLIRNLIRKIPETIIEKAKENKKYLCHPSGKDYMGVD